MFALILLLLTISKTHQQPLNTLHIRGGVRGDHNLTTFSECVSGQHLITFVHSCIGHIVRPLDAIAVALLQALPINVIQLNTTDMGTLTNGSFSGLLGYLERGETDILLSAITISTARMQHMDFTIPYASEKIGALHRRQPKRHIRFDTLSANIHGSVYGVTLLALLIIAVISVIHEYVLTRTIRGEPIWRVIMVAMPGSNVSSMGDERTPTRKIVIITVGFASLMLSAYYTSELLGALLVPVMVQAPTNLDYLEDDLLSGKMQTMFVSRNTVFEVELREKKYHLARMLQSVWAMHPPQIVTDVSKAVQLLTDGQTLLIDVIPTIHSLLSRVDPLTCGEYELITLDEAAIMQIAIALRPGYQHVAHMNAIVLERIDYTQRLLEHGILSPMCKQLLSPNGHAKMGNTSVDVHALSGVFVAYLCAIAIGVVVFCAEVGCARLCGVENKRERGIVTALSPIIELPPIIDFVDDEQIYAQYCVLLRMIEAKRRL